MSDRPSRAMPPPIPQLKRDMPLVPADSIAGRALVVVIAIMTFLACLTAGGGDADRRGLARLARRRRRATSRSRSSRAPARTSTRWSPRPPRSRSPRRASPTCTRSPRRESERMLEPWLGDGLDLGAIADAAAHRRPHAAPATASDLEPLRAALAAGAPQASLDDHRLWLSRLDTMADVIVVFAAALFVLMIVAMATAVGFATRGAMAGSREIVEVLHFVGAAERFIAGQFQAPFPAPRPPRRGDRRRRGGAVLRRGGAAFVLVARARPAARRSPRCSALSALGVLGYVAIAAICRRDRLPDRPVCRAGSSSAICACLL